MKRTMKLKIGIDFLMTVLLLCLMAYQITGQKLHEWFGTAMLFLFITHNLLNIRWYGNLCKGKYKPQRIIQTIVNFSVLISMLCLGFSGIVMSRYVFATFSISGPIAIARSMHLAASYWGFVLISIHLGMHWGMISAMLRKLFKQIKLSNIFVWMLRLAAIIIALYGLICFIQKDIISYMLLKNQFVFYDFEQNVWSVFAEYISMMILWIFAGFCISKINQK